MFIYIFIFLMTDCGGDRAGQGKLLGLVLAPNSRITIYFTQEWPELGTRSNKALICPKVDLLVTAHGREVNSTGPFICGSDSMTWCHTKAVLGVRVPQTKQVHSIGSELHECLVAAISWVDRSKL